MFFLNELHGTTEMDENVRRVLSEVGPYSDKDTLPWRTWKLKLPQNAYHYNYYWFASDVTAAMLVW